MIIIQNSMAMIGSSSSFSAKRSKTLRTFGLQLAAHARRRASGRAGVSSATTSSTSASEGMVRSSNSILNSLAILTVNVFLSHTYSNLFEHPIGLVTLAAEYLRTGDYLSELFIPSGMGNTPPLCGEGLRVADIPPSLVLGYPVRSRRGGSLRNGYLTSCWSKRG